MIDSKEEKERFWDLLKSVFSVYGGIDRSAGVIWWDTMKSFQFDQVEEAFMKAIRRSEFAPKPSTILKIIQEPIDRLWMTADEAWAIALKLTNEDTTVVTTDVILECLPVASALMPDKVAARMAFRQAYERILLEGKDYGRIPKVTISLGFEKDQRESVVQEAVISGLITSQQAVALLPMQRIDTVALLESAKSCANESNENAESSENAESIKEAIDRLKQLVGIKQRAVV